MITLDSGLPYIAGPSEEIASVQDFIGAKMDHTSGDVWDKTNAMVLFVNYTGLVHQSKKMLPKGLSCYTVH